MRRNSIACSVPPSARAQCCWAIRAPTVATAVRQRHHIDLFVPAHIEEVWIARRQCHCMSAGRRCCNTIRHGDRSGSSVVVLRPQPTGGQRCSRIQDRRVRQAELPQIEDRLLKGDPAETDQSVDHFGQPQRRQGRGAIAGQQPVNFRSGGLISQQCEHSVSIEYHSPTSSATSASRSTCLSDSVLGSLSRYLPRNSPTGSSGSGRITTRSPRSTTTTRSACHLDRTSAGMETCPFPVTRMIDVVPIQPLPHLVG
jgi:hypothetical protein